MLKTISVAKVTDGLGFGDGTISRTALQTVSGNEDLPVIVDAAVHDLRILAHVDAEAQDDGCGDGRGVTTRVGAISAKVNGNVVQFTRSLFRAKVFGGGATMATAMLIGLGTSAEKSLTETFSDAVAQLSHAGIDFGAHTDDRAQAPNCDCGAIDSAPFILEAAAKYQVQITGVILILLGLNSNDAAAVQQLTNTLAAVFDRFADKTAHTEGYEGAAVLQIIIDAGKVVKELADDHREDSIVLNNVEGYTVNQGFVREQTGDRAQVFAVDVWRIKQLAAQLYTDPDEQQIALLSELVYTLATAAVLTKGDLAIYSLSV